ncbi:hypothetical protein [Clostridium sp.]|uniref:hypothetical protein n=1 Tax=Clostridium sp. TaxID=1506 RepID=UPI003F2CC169
MFKQKFESIKLSDYYEVVNPTYTLFKLIPHNSCRNGASEKIAQLVNKVYMELQKRVYIEDKKLIVKTRSKVSYYIYIEKNKAEFFFIIPLYYKKLFKDTISDCWRNVGLEEVKSLPTFSENATKYSLGYKKEDAFSLETNATNNFLLSKTLNVMEILEEGDRVGVVYNFMPSSKTTLASFKDYYRETMKNYRDNKNIEKNNSTAWGILKSIFNYLIKTLDGVADELGADQRTPIRNSMPFNSSGNISPSTSRKENATICKSQVVVFSESSNKQSQSINGRACCEGFNVIEGDNSLDYNEMKKDFNMFDYKYPCEINETSVLECANFLQMPGRELLQQFSDISHLKVLENPVPKELQSGYFRLGVSEEKSKNRSTLAYKSSDSQLSRLGMAYLGSMGAGKTTFMTNNAYDIMNQGHGVIVIDIIEDCKLSQSIEAITPKDRLVVIDCADPKTMQSLSYNEIQMEDGLTEYEIMSRAILQCQQLALMFDAINDDNGKLSAKMIRFLYSAGSVVFSAKKNSSLKDVVDCLSYVEDRNNFIESLSDGLKVLLEDEVKSLKELTKVAPNGTVSNDDNAVRGILDRATNLTSTSAHTKLAYKKDSSTNYDFRELMKQNKVVLIKISEDQFPSQFVRNVIATFYLSKIWLSKQLLSKDFQPHTFLFFDEFYKCKNCQKLYADIFVEARKFKLTSIVALHYLNQLEAQCREALKASGTSYMLLQGADEKAYQDLRSNFQQFGYEVDDLLGLERYHALTLMKTTKNYASFIVKLPKPIVSIDDFGKITILNDNFPNKENDVKNKDNKVKNIG